jgi:CheY-like chemotaxis protein
VLVLEDEEVVSKAVARMLKELGYTFEITDDGNETVRRYAEEQAAGRPFDLVIMDLTIPGGLGGKEAVAQLRKLAPDAPVIVSSGYSDEAVMADYKAYGFDAVLPKPYKYEELAELLSRLLKK